jgi:hypothetical protein
MGPSPSHPAESPITLEEQLPSTVEIVRRLAQHVAVDDGAPGVALTMRFRRGGAWSTG